MVLLVAIWLGKKKEERATLIDFLVAFEWREFNTHGSKAAD